MHGFQHHQHQAMLHQQQIAHQQTEMARESAVQHHFQALLAPQPGVSRLRSFGRFVFSVLDLLLGG